MPDSSASFLPEVMTEAWDHYESALSDAQRDLNAESIHDLRVAIRRLGATFDFARLFLPKKNALKTGNGLRRLRKRLGPSRDIQVQLRLVAGLVDDFPVVAKFQKDLVKREKRMLATVRRSIKPEAAFLRKHFAKSLRKTRDLGSLFTADEMKAAVVGLIDIAYLKAVERSRRVDPEDASGIHELRIAFKRFRYAAEAMHTVLQILSNDQLATMRLIQRRLGDIHDMGLLIETLNKWTKRHPKRRNDVETVLDALNQKREKCIKGSLATVDHIGTFWAPENQTENEFGNHAPAHTA